MNQEETIALLKGMQNKKVDYAEMVCAPAFAYGYEYVYPEPEDYAIEEAVKSLKEIQNYRKLGTLEELARAKKYIDLAKKHGTIGEMIDECAAYEEIGTVEELKAQKENLNIAYQIIGSYELFGTPDKLRKIGSVNRAIDDLVSRKALREEVKKYRDGNFTSTDRVSYALSYVIRLINNQPTAFEIMKKPERGNENGQEEINTR